MRFEGRTGLLLGVAVFSWAAPAPDSIRAQDVTAHLQQVIAWYRDLNGTEPPAGDVLIRDNLRATSLKGLQLAFQFARAEAALLSEQRAAAQNTAASGNLQQAAQKAADRVSSAQAKIAQVDADMQKASARNRQILEAQRNELNAELDLAKEMQAALQNLVSFSGSIGTTGGALSDQIAELESAVPEAEGKAVPPAPANGKSSSTFTPESAGVLGLLSELFNNHSTRTRLVELEQATARLSDSIAQLRVPLVNEWRNASQRSDQLMNQSDSQDPAQLASAQRELSGLAKRFKQVSTAIVPLGEENIAVGTARSYLEEAINNLDQQTSRAGRYLLMHGITLAVVIFVVLFVGELWRRATFKYVRDARRRRQFLLLRRFVVAATIGLSILFGVVSEFGSLATYAGFVTAGVAVALQSPILSVVAYFFLIGRYGIKVGDRVTISGVTGDVVEIGLVRIYLMELAGTGTDLHATGRVVVFSNSVIFQPSSALYKQMPGIDYVWHTVTLTLEPESDFKLAENTLNAAVESVYEKYRGQIEQQYHSLEQSVDMHIQAPKPEVRMRYTDAGLLFTLRYPAEISQAVEMDNEILRALHDAIAREPKLNFAQAGTPKVQGA